MAQAQAQTSEMPTPVAMIIRTEPDPAARFAEAIEWAINGSRPGVRVRCELNLYRPDNQRYQPWVAHTIDVRPEPAVGAAVQEAFEQLFVALAELGPERVTAMLRQRP